MSDADAEWLRRWKAAYEDDTPLAPLFERWKKAPAQLSERELFLEVNEDLQSPWPVARRRCKRVLAEIERRRQDPCEGSGDDGA